MISETRKPLLNIQSQSLNSLKKYYHYYVLLLLPISYFIIFKYVPLYGIILAFRKYSPGGSLFGNEFVGLRYFSMFIHDQTFLRALKNTFLLSFFSLLVSFPLPILFALMLNEIKNIRFKKIVQTTSYIPYFISIVVIVGIINQILSPTTGIVNNLIKLFGGEPIHFIADPKWFRPVYIISGVWQNMGWSSILYIAAITGINSELYEAAMIDGANKFKQIVHVTIPGITPTIIITLIMSVGSLISIGYEKVLLMYNELTYTTADVISTYVYRIGLGQSNYSFATAVGLFEAVVSLMFVWFANMIARKFSETSLW